MKLRQPTMAESLDGLREQPAQFRNRLRLAVVLSQVLVDHFGERQRAAAPPITPHPLERPLAPISPEWPSRISERPLKSAIKLTSRASIASASAPASTTTAATGGAASSAASNACKFSGVRSPSPMTP